MDDGMIDVEEEECTIYIDECIASLLLQKLSWLYTGYCITLVHTHWQASLILLKITHQSPTFNIIYISNII